VVVAKLAQRRHDASHGVCVEDPGVLTQCHLAYRSIKALTCMFVPDGQSDRSRRQERICAGQNHKEGQAIVQDRFSLSGIAS
jgi:hypothetical protein